MTFDIFTSWPLVSTLAVQTAGLIWLLSALNSRIRHLERQNDRHNAVPERLARIEATVKGQSESLRRIEAHLLRSRSSEDSESYS